MKFLKIIIILLLSNNYCLRAQQVKDAFEKNYEWRIRQEYLYEVYIPKDVPDAFTQLNRLIEEPSKAKFKTMTEEEAAKKLFFSLGRWITHNWGLYEGSRLSYHIQQMGIHHPDDMTRFIIIAYHRSLTQKPLEIKELIKKFQEKETLEKETRAKRGTILYEEKRRRNDAGSGNGNR
jgi:hypothetical protein